ncbi:MAG TPA: nuclear transport factor 2 family protein [Pyrinomonadaceae bacterium]
MKFITAAAVILSASIVVFSQDYAQKIYETERAFERAVAEKGISAGFIQFLSPVGVMFFPRPENARDVYAKRPPSPAALTWNPIKIEVSSNGALGYSIGNSIYRPNGKDDKNEIHGHYLSVWARQPNGEYLAALDTGIHHEKPASVAAEWKPGPARAPETNEKKTFAGDSSIGFYQTAESRGFGRAYKVYGAEDMYLLRQGKLPLVGRDAAAEFIEDQKLAVRFTKRKSFIEAGDLAYVYSGYVLLEKNGVEKERGSFVQVWKLRDGRWQIAADVFIPIPSDS